MKKRIAKKIICTTGSYMNWDTDRQPYTIPQQRKALKVLECDNMKGEEGQDVYN
jgi:hypothetical protein